MKVEELFKFQNSDVNTLIWKDPQLMSQNFFSEGVENHVYIHKHPTRIGYYALGVYEYSLLLMYKKGLIVTTALSGINSDDSRMRTNNLAVLRLLNILLCSLLGNYQFQFSAPIESDISFSYSKSALVKIGLKANLDLDRTWSCVTHKSKHCGDCSGCIERKKVFKNLGVLDTTRYLNENKSLDKLAKKASGIISFIRRGNNNDQFPSSIESNISLSSKYSFKQYKFFANSQKGIFVYIPETNLYCHFIEKQDQYLFRYLSAKNIFKPKNIIKNRALIMNKVAKKDILNFLKLSVKAGLLFEIK